MSEKISRRGFLQTIGAAAATAVTAGAVGAYCGGKMAAAGPAAPSGAAAVYTPGTYTGTAAGMGEVKVTMTFGIIQYHAPNNLDYVISAADKLLYKGKENGRNQIVS